MLGRNREAIEDAAHAVNINSQSYSAREALAVALYADGQFELALAHFHRVFRLDVLLKEQINHSFQTCVNAMVAYPGIVFIKEDSTKPALFP